MNNYYGTFGVIAALNLSSISRLKLSWEVMYILSIFFYQVLTYGKKVSKGKMELFEKLTSLFDTNKNFKNYRDALENTEPPLVPYIRNISKPNQLFILINNLALITKFLFSIEENNSTEVDGLVNLSKLRQIYQIVKEVHEMQQVTI